MSQKIHLIIVTPQEQIFDNFVDEVYLTTPIGEIGILPNHENLMSRLSAGEMRIKKDGKIIYLATGSGLLQMSSNNLSVMTDLAADLAAIDEKEVEEAKNRAKAALEQKLTNEEHAMTLANLEKALAQLKLKRKYRFK